MQHDLAQRIEAGCAVVTPNRRLAANLLREYDAAQLASGRPVWPTPDIVPLGAFVERTYAELTRLAAGATRLSPHQEAALWEQVIAESPQGSALLSPAAAARAAREAWALQHAYRIELAGYRSTLDEDGQAYLAWSAHYEKLCRRNNWLDAARLPDAVVEALAQGAGLAARALVLYAFDQQTPQARTLAYALATRGWEVTELATQPRAGAADVTAYPDAESELAVVAECASRALAEHPGARVGVVVPDLAARRADVARIFDDVLEPGRIVSGARERARPWNISLGLPLADFPLVHAALLVLAAARGELALDEAGSLLRSPFIADAERELARRALVDAKLRTWADLTVKLGALRRAAAGKSLGDPRAAPLLAARLAAWTGPAQEARAAQRAPSQWSTTFQKLLAGLGWPGERTLDSGEYQAFRKWREIVSGLSALDAVTPKLSYEDALARLRRIAADTLFQPETPEVPVQVLGVLEATGLEFDRLFVTGLTDESWPEPPRPNPFLPVALQRAHRVPHAAAESQLEFARQATARWLGAAAAVHFSHPKRDGDRILAASPLLKGLREAEPAPRPVFYRQAVFAAQTIERLSDYTVPALAPGARVSGGSGMFKNQAACPFRAFAVHRLGAEALETGRAGLDALERGSLVHRAAANFWRELKGHAQLARMSGKELRAAIDRAAADAVNGLAATRPDAMTVSFIVLERGRLARLLAQLAALEKARAPFDVMACEHAQAIRVGGVEIRARIDRVDRLGDGSAAVLDYKTGRATAAGWDGARPDEPQLPLYALGTAGDVSAVAFVQLRAQEVAFKGLARGENALPGVPALASSRLAAEHASWAELMESWRATLTGLAHEYLSGAAPVAPKNYPGTCRYCDLKPLCRVRELMDHGPAAPEEESGRE